MLIELLVCPMLLYFLLRHQREQLGSNGVGSNLAALQWAMHGIAW